MTLDTFVIDARSTLTVLSLVSFLAIVWHTYSKASKVALDEAAQIPFADEEPVAPKSTDREKPHG